MKRAVVIAHGLHTDPAKAEAMARPLGEAILRRCPDVVSWHLYEYGWLSAMAIRFPWVGGHVRRREVGRFQAWVATLLQGLIAEHGAGVQLDAIGYSFGSYLVGHSMTDQPGPRAFYNRVILMGSILSSRDDWSDKRGHYQRALNLFSSEDEVVQFSTFGQSGWRGFKEHPTSVVDFECPKYEHDSYQRPGPAWLAAENFLRCGVPFV